MGPDTLNSTWLLLFLCNFYWIAAIVILALRVKEPHFRRLTQYGGRLAPRFSYLGNCTKLNESPRTTTVKASKINQTCNASSVRQATETTTSNSASRYIVSLVRSAEDSFLGRVSISRRLSFSVFYLSGILACAGLWISRFSLTTFFPLEKLSSAPSVDPEVGLPLLAFTIHVVVRLVECMVLHEFRDQREDQVTLFAFLSGSTFYVFAALSSDGALFYSMSLRYQQTLFRNISRDSVRNTSFNFPFTDFFQPHYLSKRSACFLLRFLFVVHILVQLLQVVHHYILADLRRASVALSKQNLPIAPFDTFNHFLEMNSHVSLDKRDGKGIYRSSGMGESKYASNLWVVYGCKRDGDISAAEPETAKNVDLKIGNSVCDGHIWSYHFPKQFLFRYVQEPHYSCEIAMYGINFTAMIVLFLSLFSGFVFWYPPDHASSGTTSSRVSSSSFCLIRQIVCMQLSAAMFLGLFTLCNLAITSVEHQVFWDYLNSARKACGPRTMPQPFSTNENMDRYDRLGKGKGCKRNEQLIELEEIPQWRLFVYLF